MSRLWESSDKDDVVVMKVVTIPHNIVAHYGTTMGLLMLVMN